MLGRTALRFTVEAAVIVAVAIGIALDNPSWSKVIAVMLPVYVVVAGFEWLVSRGRRPRPDAHPQPTTAPTETQTRATAEARPQPSGGAGVAVLQRQASPTPEPPAPHATVAAEGPPPAESQVEDAGLVEQEPVEPRETKPPAPPGPPRALEPEPPRALDQEPPTEAPEPEPVPVAQLEPQRPPQLEERPEPEPQPAPEAEPEVAPEPEVERPPLVAAPPLPPEPEPEPEPAPTPVAAAEQDVVPLVQRGPRSWNIWELERLSRAHAGSDSLRDEERAYLLVYLREFAGADGLLPVDFDGLVRESFGELVETG